MHDALCIRIRQRRKNVRLDDGEHVQGRAEAEPENDYRNDSEARAVPQLTYCPAYLGNDGSHNGNHS
jgi:hypothetical protein